MMTVRELPVIKDLSGADIEQIKLFLLQLRHPCHNQAVERHIKLVSQALTMATPFEKKDEMIRQQIHSRKLMKKFDAKR